MAIPWWERWPDRLEHELASLKEAGVPYDIDEQARLAGVIRLRLKVSFGERSVPLVVTFPDLYPFFRFEDAAPDEDLRYHQDPLSKRLCLLGRPTINWDSSTTVASAVRAQLPRVLQTAGEVDRAKVANVEEHQAEPIGDFYPLGGPHLMTLLIDGSWRLPADETAGTLLVGLRSEPVGPTGALQGAVLEVRSNARKTLASADPCWAGIYKAKTFTCRWIRVSSAIRQFEPKTFFDQVQQQDLGRSSNFAHAIGNLRLQIWGVVFPEEIEWRGAQGDGWVFVCRFERQRSSVASALSPLIARKGLPRGLGGAPWR